MIKATQIADRKSAIWGKALDFRDVIFYDVTRGDVICIGRR